MYDPRGLVANEGQLGIGAENDRGLKGLLRRVLLFELALLRFELRQDVLLERLCVAREERREQRLSGLGNQRGEERANLPEIERGRPRSRRAEG